MTDKEKFRVRFAPYGLEILVPSGTNLLEAARSAGVPIQASCGGTGVCGTCKVKIEKGVVESVRTRSIGEEDYVRGVWQACQSRIVSDLEVFIPAASRLEKAILARERKPSADIAPTGWRFNPPLAKYYLEVTPPTLGDNTSDLSRILRSLKQTFNLENLHIELEVIRHLPEVCRKEGWKITVSILSLPLGSEPAAPFQPRIIKIEPGDTRSKHFALAVDVGTTTVCAQILDLNKAEILADAIVFNKQISYGADVITRIAYSQKPAGLRTLQEAVVSSINEIINRLLAQVQIQRQDIGLVMEAGNTTMTQLLLGLDPRYIRLAPYTPTTNFIPPGKAASFGIDLAENVYLFAFPSVSSYIGGDIVSGIIPAGFFQRTKLTFYMDIGTNGEIVIGNMDWMVTASCSAGPAFEGGGIRFGMVAIPGAIQDFNIDPLTLEPSIETIGREKPKGICGSGLINTIAGLLEVGAIGQNGKFNTNLSTPRIREGLDGYEYVLAWASDTQIDQDIVISEVDIDNLIRAKAAMYAGCHTLARAVGVDCLDFEHVILAGNFGNSVNIEKAITIGLLPDIPRERFIFIGNGALSGARLAAYSSDLLAEGLRVARMLTNIELSDNVEFNNNYIAALFLPHTQSEAFPSVKIILDSLKTFKATDGEK